jgi:outer membrane cobalamin receptor
MLNPLSRGSAFVALFTLLTAPVGAGAVPESPAEDEITVVVTAERVAHPVTESIATTTIVTAAEIRRQGAMTVADALRAVPGLTIRQNGQFGALTAPSIRGTTPNQTLVLVDGQRVTSAAFQGGIDLAKFPVDDVDRIEVLRGPAASLYGSDAIGGVINILTRRPTANGGRVSLGYGGHGRAARAVQLHGVSARGDWQLAGTFPAFDGTRPNSDFAATDLSGVWQLADVAGWQVALRGEDYHDRLGLPGADYPGAGVSDLDDRMTWTRTLGSLVATRSLGPGLCTLAASHVRQELDNTMPGLDWLTGTPTTARSQTTGMTNALELTYSAHRQAHRWTGGGEYRDESYRNCELQDGISQSTQDTGDITRAVFVQDRWTLTSRTDLVVGARFDDYAQAGSRLSPRAGIHHQLSPALTLRASYGEGFRAPSLVERYYNAFGLAGNPTLRPESSRQSEVGANWLLAQGSLDLAVFHNLVEDQITWGSTTFENIDRARQHGVEVAWATPVGAHTALTLGYTYLDALNTTTGTRLLRVPHNQLSLTATHTMGAWETSLTGSWLDRRPDYGGYDPITFASLTTILPARASLDLTVTHTGVRGVRPYVVVRNLTNEPAPELAGYPVEGRSLEGGVRAHW